MLWAMQGSTSKTVAIVYGTRLEAITVAPLIHALEGHPWLSTVVMTSGSAASDELDDVHDVFAIGPEAADPAAGPIAPNALVEWLQQSGAVAAIAAGATAASLVAGTTADVPLVVIDRGDVPANVSALTALLHLVSSEARATALVDAGAPAEAVRVVGDPAAQALGELIADAAALPNDAMAAVYEDTPNWSDCLRREYAREEFLHSVLVDPQLRSLLAVAASPFHDGGVSDRCVEALEQLLAQTTKSDDNVDWVAA